MRVMVAACAPYLPHPAWLALHPVLRLVSGVAPLILRAYLRTWSRRMALVQLLQQKDGLQALWR